MEWKLKLWILPNVLPSECTLFYFPSHARFLAAWLDSFCLSVFSFSKFDLSLDQAPSHLSVIPVAFLWCDQALPSYGYSPYNIFVCKSTLSFCNCIDWWPFSPCRLFYPYSTNAFISWVLERLRFWCTRRMTEIVQLDTMAFCSCCQVVVKLFIVNCRLIPSK